MGKVKEYASMPEFFQTLQRAILAASQVPPSPEKPCNKEPATHMATPKDRFANAAVRIKREGTQITLPADPFPMSTREAIAALERREAEDEAEMRVHEEIPGFLFDGAAAFMDALKERYGWASPQPTPSFFGPQPPTTVSIATGIGTYRPIVWGRFSIPGVDGYLESGKHMTEDGKIVFRIGGVVRKKHAEEVALIAQLARRLVVENSLYRGKALRIRTTEDGLIDLKMAPEFLDLREVNPDELTFSDDTHVQVETNLFTPVEQTLACREHRIPLKRGVLLEGPYGTGKTLTAFVTAKKCLENGWTFMLIDRVQGLKEGLRIARQYAPCVVFAEDIDRSVTGERSTAMDDVLNTIDGVESKGTEVITILTSNHVDKINPAMIRPGRLDAVISIQAPDAKAAEKLMRLYARGLIQPTEDLAEAGAELAGQIPAMIREVVERAKLYAIRRAKGPVITLSGSDLAEAARGMTGHMKLLNGPKAPKPTAAEALGAAFESLVKNSLTGDAATEAASKVVRSSFENKGVCGGNAVALVKSK